MDGTGGGRFLEKVLLDGRGEPWWQLGGYNWKGVRESRSKGKAGGQEGWMNISSLSYWPTSGGVERAYNTYLDGREKRKQTLCGVMGGNGHQQLRSPQDFKTPLTPFPKSPGWDEERRFITHCHYQISFTSQFDFSNCLHFAHALPRSPHSLTNISLSLLR